jgi:hypothetical protein
MPRKQKKNNLNFKNVIKQTRKQLFKSVWGTDAEKYNLVSRHQPCVNFLAMQIIRLLSLIALFGVFGSYVYVYLRIALQ